MTTADRQSSVASDSQPSRAGWPWLVAAVILVLAAVLRIAGAANDLWLDEIWSLQLAGQVQTPTDVITSLHHDNNHYLNTWWLWLLGIERNPLWYRLPSVLAGTATVALAGWIGWRRSAATGLLAAGLFAVNYAMVLYASEARGYATACCFALLGYASLERFFETRRGLPAAVYVISCVLGLLSHPVFISFLGAAVVSSLYWLLEPLVASRTRGAEISDRSKVSWQCAAILILSQCVPLALLAVLYVVDLRQMTTGGGAISNSLVASYAEAMAWTWGVTSAGLPPLAGVLLVVVVAGFSLHFEWLISRRRAIFFAAVIVFFPLALALARDSHVLYPRYFILSIEFLLLLASFWLGALWPTGATARLGVAALLGVFVAFNGAHLVSLMRHGRGDTTGVLQLIAGESRGGEPTIGVDHVLRVGLPASYVARTAIPAVKLHFTRSGFWSPDPPDWYISHRDSFEEPVPYPAEGLSRGGNRYELAGVFPAAPLSGLHWFVYRRL